MIATARKLAVLLHHLWVSGEVYQPLHTAVSSCRLQPRKRQCCQKVSEKGNVKPKAEFR